MKKSFLLGVIAALIILSGVLNFYRVQAQDAAVVQITTNTLSVKNNLTTAKVWCDYVDEEHAKVTKIVDLGTLTFTGDVASNYTSLVQKCNS